MPPERDPARARTRPGTGCRPAGRPAEPDHRVATTEATVPDAAMTTPIHQQLEERQLLPGEHLVDRVTRRPS